MILLVTNRRDITTDYVVAEIRRRQMPFFRLNTELLPSSLCTMSDRKRSSWSIAIDGKEIRGDQVKAAYFRRPGAPILSEEITDTGEKGYIAAEWGSFLKSLYMRLEGQWLNEPTNIFLAEDKPRQLLMADELGFDTPQACITNDIRSVRATTFGHPSIAKPLREALLAGNNERVMFTSRVRELLDADASSIALAPIIVQHEIIKKYDIRATVVGHQVFATAIWSQDNKETEVDWRQGARTDLKHERIELPADVSQKCIKLVTSLGLKFGAIDFICDRQDKLWFLEINPNGQWAWIENLTGYPIAQAIVDELAEISKG